MPVSSASYVNSRRDDGTPTTTRSVTNSVNSSHANVSANNDTGVNFIIALLLI